MNGSVSPTFEYDNYKGGKTKLEDFRGKYVYIDVWATWCGPCRQEIPFLKKTEEKYHGKNIVFLSMSIDKVKDVEKWRTMAKDLEMGYLLDFYGEVLTEKQREMLRQYYNDDLSLSEIGENFGITRQGARDAIKHGENALKELEEKVGFAARYRRVQQKLEELEQMVIDARFECTGPQGLTTTEYEHQLTKMLKLIRSIDEANES
jgi:predicted DNA-binding protein YlxM (UPF0122 family)